MITIILMEAQILVGSHAGSKVCIFFVYQSEPKAIFNINATLGGNPYMNKGVQSQ